MLTIVSILDHRYHYSIYYFHRGLPICSQTTLYCCPKVLCYVLLRRFPCVFQCIALACCRFQPMCAHEWYLVLRSCSSNFSWYDCVLQCAEPMWTSVKLRVLGALKKGKKTDDSPQSPQAPGIPWQESLDASNSSKSKSPTCSVQLAASLQKA